ncbi:selenocysteine-specific translation elongation factor [Kamptonema cortianum]|nr:selenocysteine-specific translation elongation factor [Geitlerinema splendidum]MDK3162279.1 selenocysteine-specific translation elongation factor [Kamptonema cortianum]
MSKLIGTAGHVDHGKTSLVRALTGIDADRLPDEKRRGLTIDIGFAHVELEDFGRVSVVDVPGHERFVANMLVGAMGMDVVMLCVAADQGVMPQTIEHFQVVQLLPVEKLVVVMTRRDLADADTAEIARLQVEELLAPTRFAGAPFLEVDSLKGTGIAELKSALVDALRAAEVVKEGLWYLPVDRVFTKPGFGTIVTGTLARGVIKVGEPCVVLPQGEKTRAKGIQAHGKSTGEADAGTRVALNLAQVGVDEITRGDVIAEPGACFVTECTDVRMVWLERPKHGARIRISVGSDEVIGKVMHNDHDETLAQLRTERPTVVAKEQAVIIRTYSPMRVIGGGRVLVPEARVRRKNAPAGELTTDDPASGSLVAQIVAKFPQGAPTSEVIRLLGMGQQQAADAIEAAKQSGEILGFAGLWFTGQVFRDNCEALTNALKRLHESEPAKAMLPREQAVKVAGLSWRGKALDRIVTQLHHERVIRVSGTNICLAEHRPQLNQRQQALLDRVVELLTEAGYSVPAPHEMNDKLNVPPQAITEILRTGVESGILIRLDDNVFYTQEQFGGFVEEVRRLMTGKRFSAAEYKEAVGTSRKYAIPILEHMDSLGVTMRQGDVRIVKA